MNITKIVAALNQTDQLCEGLLAYSNKEVGCTITQLFYAAGKTRDEIEKACKNLKYEQFFDGLLVREYTLDESTIKAIWQANDIFNGSDKARHLKMISWFEAEAEKEENKVEEAPEYAESTSRVCVGVEA